MESGLIFASEYDVLRPPAESFERMPFPMRSSMSRSNVNQTIGDSLGVPSKGGPSGPFVDVDTPPYSHHVRRIEHLFAAQILRPNSTRTRGLALLAAPAEQIRR